MEMINLKSLKNPLIIILIISAIFVFLINFILHDIPEIICYGYELGIVINAISLSYIAAYIFYFFQNLIQKQHNLVAIKSPTKNINDKFETFWKILDIDIHSSHLNEDLTNNLKTKNMLDYSSQIKTIINHEIIYYKHCEFIQAFYKELHTEIFRINQLNKIDLELNLLLDKVINADLFKINEQLLSLHLTSGFMPIGNGYIHLFESMILDYNKLNNHIQYILKYNNK